MIAESLYNKIDIPNVSLWQFLFERQNKPFPDDKGRSIGLSIQERTF